MRVVAVLAIYLCALIPAFCTFRVSGMPIEVMTLAGA